MKFSVTIRLILLQDLLPCDTHTRTHARTHAHAYSVSSQTQILLQRKRFFLLYNIIFIIYFQGFIGINSYIVSMYVIFCTSNIKQINAFFLF